MTHELIYALFAWATQLSGYPAAPAPDVELVPHERIVQLACGGHKCNVVGFHADGAKSVQIDERLDPEHNLFGASILVHEFVHYLQQASGAYPIHYTCSQAIAMEREAYLVQSQFLTAYGVYYPVGVVIHFSFCMKES